MTGNDNQISLKELILKIQEWVGYLLSKWLVIFIVGVIGVGLGFLYAACKKPTYTGTLTFVLSNDSKDGGGLSSLAGQFGLDVGSGGESSAFEGDNIIELLKSRRIVKGALFKEVPGANEILINIIADKTGLLKVWKMNARLNAFVPFPDDVNKIVPIQDSLIGVIQRFLVKNYVSVGKPDKKLSFYQLSTTSPDEAVSIYLTKNMVDEAAKMYIDTKTKTAKENLEMLQHEADSLRNRLSGTIYSSASAIDQTFNLNPALQTQRAPIQQGQVQAQVLTVAYGEVVKNLELAKIALQKETPLYQVIDEPQYPLTMNKLSKIIGGMAGGIIAGFICVLWLLVRRSYKNILGNK